MAVPGTYITTHDDVPAEIPMPAEIPIAVPQETPELIPV